MQCVYFPSRKGPLLTRVQLSDASQVLSCQAALQQSGPQPVLVPGADPPQVQDFVFSLAEFHISVNIYFFHYLYVESIQILATLQ